MSDDNTKKAWSRNHKFKGEDTMYIKVLVPTKLWSDLREIAKVEERQYSDQLRLFLKKGIEGYKAAGSSNG